MPETSDRLAFVAMDGRSLPHSHAVLIDAPWGWHVALYGVPQHSCPLLKRECEITLETHTGYRYAGRVSTELVKANGVYVLLAGVGQLTPLASADAA
jgi:hypothetical protein